MLEAIRRFIAFLRHKQILHKVGVAISITVIGIACYVLYHMLRGIDIAEVLDAIKGTEPSQIGLAALFVALGYFTLTFYDWFAVRAIGRSDMPYRVNALAGFTFWLGNAAVLGLGIAWHPEAAANIDQLPVWLNRAAAFVTILALIGYVAWVWVKP